MKLICCFTKKKKHFPKVWVSFTVLIQRLSQIYILVKLFAVLHIQMQNKILSELLSRAHVRLESWWKSHHLACPNSSLNMWRWTSRRLSSKNFASATCRPLVLISSKASRGIEPWKNGTFTVNIRKLEAQVYLFYWLFHQYGWKHLFRWKS